VESNPKIKSLSPFFLATALVIFISSDVCFASECKIPGWGYAIHDNHVYYGWHDPSSASETVEFVVVDADPLTFSAIGHTCRAAGPIEPPTALDRFGKDKKFVFLERKKIDGADPASFELIDYSHEKDKVYVYFMGERISNRPAQFHHLNDQASYATDGKYFYYGHNKMLASGFAVFPEDSSYAKNKTTVFHAGVPVAEADPATFSLSANNTPITKDKRHVFYKDMLIPGADPDSFQEIGYSGMGMDKHSVYIETKSFPDINKDGLKVSEFSEYLINTDAVYRIFWDDDNVSLQKLPAANPKTFHSLGTGWAKDDRQVYYRGNTIPQADSASFELLNVSSARDYRYGYSYGKVRCTRNSEGDATLPHCELPF
jgi:hypothetical protein